MAPLKEVASFFRSALVTSASSSGVSCAEEALVRRGGKVTDEPSTDARPTELRRRLTPLGRTSLLTETPANRSVPTFLLRVQGHLTRKEITALLNDKLRLCERFHSRIDIAPRGRDAHFVGPAVVPSSNESSSSSSSTKSPMIYDCSPHVKTFYHDGGDGTYDSAHYTGLKVHLADIINAPIDMPADAPQWEVFISELYPPSSHTPLFTPNPSHSSDNPLLSWVSAGDDNDGAPESGNGAIEGANAEHRVSDDGYYQGGDSTDTLVLFRLHHALADGIAVAALLSSLTDEGEELLRDMILGAVDGNDGRGKAGDSGKKKRTQRKKRGKKKIKERKLFKTVHGGIIGRLAQLVSRMIRLTGRLVLGQLGGVLIVFLKYACMLLRSFLYGRAGGIVKSRAPLPSLSSPPPPPLLPSLFDRSRLQIMLAASTTAASTSDHLRDESSGSTQAMTGGSRSGGGGNFGHRDNGEGVVRPASSFLSDPLVWPAWLLRRTLVTGFDSMLAHAAMVRGAHIFSARVLYRNGEGTTDNSNDCVHIKAMKSCGVGDLCSSCDCVDDNGCSGSGSGVKTDTVQLHAWTFEQAVVGIVGIFAKDFRSFLRMVSYPLLHRSDYDNEQHQRLGALGHKAMSEGLSCGCGGDCSHDCRRYCSCVSGGVGGGLGCARSVAWSQSKHDKVLAIGGVSSVKNGSCLRKNPSVSLSTSLSPSSSVSVAELKEGVSTMAPGATINDAVLACVTGAIGDLAVRSVYSPPCQFDLSIHRSSHLSIDSFIS